MVKALLAYGADPNERLTTTTMLMSYIGYPERGAFERFACGTGDLRGATPLWVAAFGAATDGSYRGGAVAKYVQQAQSSTEVIRALLDAGADQHLTTDDGTTPFMAAAGLGRSTFRPNQTRGTRSRGAEEAVKVLLEAGAAINAKNEADFTALHGAAFRGLNEVVEYLVEQGADIDARDFRGRTPFRLAEGSKQSFQFQGLSADGRVSQEPGRQHPVGHSWNGPRARRPRRHRESPTLTEALRDFRTGLPVALSAEVARFQALLRKMNFPSQAQ